MKKYRVLAILFSVLFFVTAITYAAKPESAFEGKSSGSQGCKANSKAPEIFTFYGDAKTVLDKVGNFSMDLPQRRMYLIFVETENSAEMKIYEQSGENKVVISTWKGPSAADLKAKLNAAIMENKGANCVGDQVKALLDKELGDHLFKTEEPVAAPESGTAAIRHGLQDAGEKYVDTAFYLFC